MNERRAPAWLTGWEYAHRGLHTDDVPENSLAAARAALEAGMGIECDIQMSRDGVPMVFHDWELDRLARRSAITGETDASDLEQLILVDSEERVYRLSALLDMVAGRVPVLIEIKSKPGYDVVRSCKAVIGTIEGYVGAVAVMSFDPRVAAWMRDHAPEFCCGLVMREDRHGYTQTAAERFEAYDHAEPDFLAYHIEALPSDWVEGLRKSGLPVLTWTVNSPETRARAQIHADAMISEGRGVG